MLPGPGSVAASLKLIALERRHRGHQQPRITVRAQCGVDLVEHAESRLQRQPGQDLAHEGAVDLGSPIVIIVVDEDQIEIAAVAQFLAAELAVGDHRDPVLIAVALTQVLPAPVEHAVQIGIGQRRQIVRDLLNPQLPFDIAHQSAEGLRLMGSAQRIQQRPFVGLA